MEPTPAAASVPSAEQIREKAAEIVARSDYDLQVHQVDTTWLNDLLMEILRWLATPFTWLFRATEGWPDVLRWLVVIGFGALALLLVAHILYTLIRAAGGPTRARNVSHDARKRGPEPAELEQSAEAARARGDFITAVRFLFRSLVVRLERHEEKPHRPGTTNRELLRRYRNREQVVDSLRNFVEVIDAKWYGDEVCTELDYAACRNAHELVCRNLSGGPRHALRA